MKSTHNSSQIIVYTLYRTFVFGLLFVSVVTPLTVFAGTTAAKKTTAAPAKTMSRAPAGISDSQKSLEIRGQSRNLSMLLVLKNRHENIDFVKPRDSYREEIQKTGF